MWEKNCYMWYWNYIMWKWNCQMWEKCKGATKYNKWTVTCDVETTKYEKRTVTCDVGTTQCEDRIVKCEKNIRNSLNLTKKLSRVMLELHNVMME